MEIKSLSTFIEIAKQKITRKLVVAAAADEPVLIAVKNAYQEGIIIPILVGEKTLIEKIAKKNEFDISKIEIFNEPDAVKASVKAVSFIKEGKAEILMKGLVSTGVLLKAVLDKENGLKKGASLSHIAFFESPYYHKLLAVTDAAMNVYPEFNDKVDILKNAIEVFHKLGIENPKVAIVCAVETVNEKMPPTIHAAMLTMMNKRGQITGCIVDGPLALDNAISKEAAHHKGIKSEVAGDADLILTPNIESGNILYKSLNFLGGAVTAAIIIGAKVPIVLTSRADSDRSKLLSIALAAAME
ncbi:MAG: phosphate butyryltransferase [Bacteroidetes bacterium GWA2_30_7]|nr:MAG: phosphate butyryltransferase [Bacteroidetes bacterium GWA2_30_7]